MCLHSTSTSAIVSPEMLTDFQGLYGSDEQTARKRSETEMAKYQVIYLWKGERHRVLETYVNKTQALEAVRAIRAQGLSAWIETI
jgi:hypothetical protein